MLSAFNECSHCREISRPLTRSKLMGSYFPLIDITGFFDIPLSPLQRGKQLCDQFAMETVASTPLICSINLQASVTACGLKWGNTLFTADSDGVVQVYAAFEGAARCTLVGHGSRVADVAWGPGAQLASCGRDDRARRARAAHERDRQRECRRAHAGLPEPPHGLLATLRAHDAGGRRRAPSHRRVALPLTHFIPDLNPWTPASGSLRDL